jgi:hypothetical protein
MFNELRFELTVRFVDISRIVAHDNRLNIFRSVVRVKSFHYH